MLTKRRRTPNRPARRNAFTLIEILIVVVILGILASIIIPQFSNASQLARQNTLKDEMRYLRTQIIVYKAQHFDIAPGYPAGNPSGTPTEADFLSEMTNYTDEHGNTNASFTNVYQYGPYLSSMPINPVNSKSNIDIIADGGTIPTTPTGDSGFYYLPQTQTIVPNVVGNDTDGVPYSSY